MKTIRRLLVMLGLLTALCASATVTITNPLLYADVPDPDVICVGKDYYMISTTCHMSPGAPIMHSRDMKHWRIVSYVFDALHESPRNDLNGGNIYSRGQWATCIRHHKGLFYVFFGTGEKSYIYTAENAAGPWTLHHQFDEYYHDASLLFDDDGRSYLVYNAGTLTIKEFNSTLTGWNDGGLDADLLTLADGCLLEGSHIYKIDGRYYITMIWWPRGGIRTQLCWRSDNIRGPYEHRVTLSDDLGYANHGVAQGGIWKAHNGRWYAMLFQDHEGVGRIPCLMPVTWSDGWPMMGDSDGKVPSTFTIPGIKESGRTEIAGSDDFSAPTLPLFWQWNHNPDPTAWSLSERRGWLRLHTSGKASNIFEARNTITQRTIGPACTGTAKFDVSHMAIGDRAGIAAFCSQPGELTVERTADGYTISMADRQKTIETAAIAATTIWLRMDCDFTTDTAYFLYSTDGVNFTLLGDGFHMIFSMDHFTGNKFALFNYSTGTAGGYVDIDSFELKVSDTPTNYTNRWSADKAAEWAKSNPWFCGVNYIPAYAVNYTAMFDKSSFNPEAIRSELALMKNLGMNCVRFVMQEAVWADDPDYFIATLDRFLTLCDEAGVKAMPIFFDDCIFGTNNNPTTGLQPKPLEGWYAWNWSPSPGTTKVVDPRHHAELERYVKQVMQHFATDSRIMLWDLYNEPTNNIYGEHSWPLLRKVFSWAREINPSQPISAAMWNDNARLNSFLARNSDVITFHVYANAEGTRKWIDRALSHGRPAICTEWMNRPVGSTIGECLSLFADSNVGCMLWGLVNGLTQTHLPWGHRPEHGAYGGVWQHDIYRGDHSPYNPAETQQIKKVIENMNR